MPLKPDAGFPGIGSGHHPARLTNEEFPNVADPADARCGMFHVDGSLHMGRIAGFGASWWQFRRKFG
ncbi:hypothetical protein [Dyella sp. S184]|uniref:hypothetical protein n=1 Tax=Dyella sp. S184 TaxID=1641862 RepID=UPI00131B1AA5|nr:hypothetical protein [Dyella sp. S184]